MSMVYTEGDYTFVNRKVDNGFVFPNPVFRLAPKIERSPFTYDDVFDKVKQNGGYLYATPEYITAHPGTTDRYSSGNYYSIFDVYVGAGFGAVVYRQDSEIGIVHVYKDDSGLAPVSFDFLTPDNYLCTSANKYFGLPTVKGRWFALGNNFWQEIETGNLAAIDADYYCLSGQSLYAAFGVHASKIPWLYMPRTVKAGSAIAQIYRGNMKVSDGELTVPVPMGYTTRDMGNDGICITSELRTEALSLRNKLTKAKDVASLKAFKRAIFPGFSNDDSEWSGTIQYVLPNGTAKANPDKCNGVIYCDGNGTDCLTTDIAEAFGGTNMYLTHYKYILNDSAINEALTKAEIKRQKAILKVWLEQVRNLHDAISHIIPGINGYAIQVCDEVFSNLGSEVKKTLEGLGMASNNINITGFVKPEIQRIEVPEIPSACETDADVCRQTVRNWLGMYGLGQKYGALVQHPTDDMKKRASTAIKSKMKLAVLAPLNASLASLSEQLAKMTFSLTNTVVYDYKVLFKTKSNDPMRMYLDSEGNLKDRSRITNVSVTSNGKLSTVVFDLDVKMASKRLVWEGADSSMADALKSSLRALSAATGWNATYLGEGDVVEAAPNWWLCHTTSRKISKLFCKMRGAGYIWQKQPEYDEVRWQKIRISKTISFDLKEEITFNIGASSDDVELFVVQTDSAAKLAGLIAYAEVLYDYKDEIATAGSATPLVTVKGFIATPTICNQFFNCAFSDPIATAEAIATLTVYADAEEDPDLKSKFRACAQLLEELSSQYASLVRSDANKLGWIAKKKLEGLGFVEDVDVAPLAMWMLREEG